MSLFREHNTRLADGAQLDAFNRLRVSDTFTQLDVSQVGAARPDLLDTLIAGAGSATHQPNESTTNMSVTTTGDRVVMQSKRYGYYQPGKSLLIEVTGVLDVGTEKARMGYFDDHTDKTVDSRGNGYFVQVDNGAVVVCERSYVTGAQVDNAVAQASWNIDVMDGTGVSGKTLDLTKSNIFVLDGQWLGVGRVRLGFVIDGLICYVHEFNHAGVNATTYITSFSLPIRWEIESNGGAATMKSICGSIQSEGGFNPRGFLGSFNTSDNTIQAVNGAESNFVAVKMQDAFVRSSLNVLNISTAVINNTDVLINIYLADSITGGTWTNSPDSYSQSNLGFTAFTGRLVDSIYLSSRTRGALAELQERIFTGCDIEGNAQAVVITGIGLGGNGNTYVGLTYQELI